MPLPTLTPEQRANALAKAAEVRTARAAIKASTTTLAAVLDRSAESAVGKLKVQALLEALPKVGNVRAADIMDELGIAPTRRIDGLGERQRAGPLLRFAG
ncbi:integration host factor, actinobacterial type [Tsukamurella pseudospumae]|uniref:Integration host factor n=1 Tax=Tsukamurella pseudospumae TaxID=239498 RepID=A0A137ZSA9_9ACTN|nr:integration host factor, actinobacterial type [Tsukamurella pseudospumae]KXP01066.1 integration host factor [Tsukamurella pseudospumae]